MIKNDDEVNLLQGVGGGANLSSDQAAQLDLIGKSVAAREPGGGHMVELLRALHPPAEEESGAAETRVAQDLDGSAPGHTPFVGFVGSTFGLLMHSHCHCLAKPAGGTRFKLRQGQLMHSLQESAGERGST
jgi:hypothetical protein